MADGTCLKVIERAVRLALEAADDERPGGRREHSPSGTYLVGDFSSGTSGSGASPTSLELREARRFASRARVVAGQAEHLADLSCPRDYLEATRRVAAELEVFASLLVPGVPAHLEKEPSSVRPKGRESDLFEFAVDITTQGCVVETYEAARWTFQARSVTEPSARRTAETVGLGLREHAALYWALSEWALGQLSPARGRLIRDLRQQACSDLRATFCVPLVPSTSALGLPTERVAHCLLDVLEHDLLVSERAA